MEEYIVTAFDMESCCEIEITVLADEAETSDEIVLKCYVAGEEISGSDYNYLSAYQKLRDAFLQRGFGLKCKGSNINAIQSGMMGANDKIYLVEMEKPASKDDIVSLYDYSDISTFPDTQVQKDFFEKWCESI